MSKIKFYLFNRMSLESELYIDDKFLKEIEF